MRFMILVKATPLLFLLGIEDIVYWARELGSAKTRSFAYPHPDWRLYYFIAVLVFYLLMTWVSERVLDRVIRRLSAGQATMAGEAQRKAGVARPARRRSSTMACGRWALANGCCRAAISRCASR